MSEKIDWSKPIEYRSICKDTVLPAKLIGRDDEFYIVKVGVAEFFRYTEDGWNFSRNFRVIYNKPPEPVIHKLYAVSWTLPPNPNDTRNHLLIRQDRYVEWLTRMQLREGFVLRALKEVQITDGDGIYGR